MPPEYFGLVSQTWPSSGSTPAFPVGRLSNYDNSLVHWRSLHTATNTINWGALDSWVSIAKAAGVVKGTYVVYGTPTFLAQGYPGTGDSVVVGPYGGLGECSYPTNLAQCTYFAQQFAARNISTWGNFFDVISLWNEPNFDGTRNGFWWSNATNFVDTLYTFYTAFKAADSTLKIATPGTFWLNDGNTASHFSGLLDWVNAAGTINPTKHGYDCYNSLATHPYHATPDGLQYSGMGTLYGLPFGGVNPFRAKLLGTGTDQYEMHSTEYGYSSSADANVAWFLAQTPAYRETFIQRLWMSGMLYGLKSMHVFSYGNVASLTGDLATDDPGVVSGLRKVYNGCAGKTITSGGTKTDSTVVLNFSDGTSYTV